MIRVFMVLYFSTIAGSAAAAETATLKMRFVFDGIPPPQKQININPAVAPLGGPPIDERLLVDQKTKGIKNVLVYVDLGRGASKMVVPPAPNQRRRLVMANGRFDPHVLIARAGDTLELVDRGPNQHNPNFLFFQNQEIVGRPGNPRLLPVPKPEPAPVPVHCNVHPWMRAYVVVLEHQFAALSDSDGNLEIAGLPTGTSVKFRVFHEAGSIQRVKMLGAETDWFRSRFEVKLNPGTHDFGEIQVPPEALNP